MIWHASLTNSSKCIGTVAESLTNNIFNLPSLEARTAKENAEALQKWMSVNQQAAQPYENYLLFFFKIWTSAPPSNHSVREQIWQRFTLFLSSTEYSRSWHNLYKSANVTMNSPILSCYITYKFFIEFWKGKYQLPAPSQHKYLWLWAKMTFVTTPIVIDFYGGKTSAVDFFIGHA